MFRPPIDQLLFSNNNQICKVFSFRKHFINGCGTRLFGVTENLIIARTMDLDELKPIHT